MNSTNFTIGILNSKKILIPILLTCMVGIDSLKLLETPPESLWIREGDSVNLTCASDDPWNMCSFSFNKTLKLTKAKASNDEYEYSCSMEINFADTDNHEGPWMCHLQDFNDNRFNIVEASFTIQVATKSTPEISFTHPETLSIIDLNNEVQLNTTLSIRCFSKGLKIPKPTPTLKLFIATEDGVKKELGSSSSGHPFISLNYTLENGDADCQFICESLQTKPDDGEPGVKGDLNLFREEEKSPKINLIFKPFFEGFSDSYVYNGTPIDLEVNFFSRPAPIYAVWQDENNNELNDPTRFKFINYEQDPEKSGKYKLQLSVFNLTKDTFVKLLVTNSVDQQEALLTIKVMDENPESPPVAYAASMGKISIWIAIGILVLIVLVGYVIFRARKSIVCKATPEVEIANSYEIKENGSERSKRDLPIGVNGVTETKINLDEENYFAESENKEVNEDSVSKFMDETDDELERKEDDEITLTPEIEIAQTFNEDMMQANNSLPKAYQTNSLLPPEARTYYVEYCDTNL